MNVRKSSRYTLFVLGAVLSLVLTACQSSAQATSTQPPQPTATQAVQATPVPVQPTQPPAGTASGISLDYSAVAQSVTEETVAAVSVSGGGPITGAGPEYRRLTLQGYPVSGSLLMPQIFVYPAGDLASTNETMGKMAADLQTLLQSQQAGDKLPFLPLYNEAQMMHAQVQYLDFKSGKGVRFLTQYAQAPVPVANDEVIYTFQGLTSDGKYYVAAVLPVTNPVLPASSSDPTQQANVRADYQGYLSKLVAGLNQDAASSFTPDLSKLDALVSSIEVK